MTDERIDIIVEDKVSPRIVEKLREIGAQAKSADTSIARLNRQLAALNSSGIDKLANATARLQNSQARQVSAQARLTSATARFDSAAAKAAVAQQKLATETARTAREQQRANAEASKAATAAIATEAASSRLAAAKNREAAATRAASVAQSLQNKIYTQGNALSRQSRQQLLNLTYQLNDIVVGLASGQRPLTVLLQQGSQISTIFGGGLAGLKQLGQAFTTLIPPQVLAALVAAGAGFAILTKEIRTSTGVQVSFGDVAKASIQVLYREIKDVLTPAVKALSPIFGAVYKAIVATFKGIVNAITAPFALAYNQIVTLYSHLPQAFGEIFVAAFNLIIIVIEKAINNLIEGLNALNGPLNAISKKLGGLGGIQLFDTVSLGRVETDFGNLNALVTETGSNIKGALTDDRAGKLYDKIAEQAVKNKRQRDAEEAAKGSKKATFADIVKEYEVQIEGLRKVGLERERILAIGQAEDKLNRKLTEGERARLSGLVDMLETLKLVNEINQPIIDLQSQLPLLDAALAQGGITQEQYTRRVTDLNLAVLGLSNDLGSGLQAGLLKVKQEFTNVADVASNLVTNSFKSAEDALVQFVQTGKLDFKSLIDSMIADLIRLQIRQAITSQIAGAIDGGNIGSSFLSFVGRNLPSFAVGTDRVPYDMTANIHKDEMIIPASQARQIRAGSSVGTTGDVQVNNTVSITMQGGNGGSAAADTQKVQQAVQQGIEAGMADFMRRQQKVGGMLNNRTVA